MNFEKMPSSKESSKEEEIKLVKENMELKENSKHRFSRAEKEKILKNIENQK